MSQAIRCIWIIKLPTTGAKKSATVLFSRSFPTAEKRAKLRNGKGYTPVPSAPYLLPLFVQEISQTHGASQFIASRDQCDLPIQKPVYRIHTEQGFLWPIVAVEKNGFLFCCLPLVDTDLSSESSTDLPLIDIPSVSLGFGLLGAIAEYLKVPKQDLASRLTDLPTFLNEAAPFGSVRDTSVENILARVSNKPCTISKSHKLPAWRSSSYKGKAVLHICISESISASQCAQEMWQDISQVYGSVTCKAEVEGHGTDITLSITHQGDGLGIPLDRLMVHPCVQRADWQDLDKTGGESSSAPRRVRFSPPIENFTLCHYTVKRLLELPIFGVYHMKPEDMKASITVQLKLNDQIKNSFEYCELHIPFYTRASISNLEGTPTQGSLSLSSNKKEIVWNIGQKFTSKDQQALLAATVTFSSSEQGFPAPTVEDAFCRGNNSYAQLYFKVQDFTHSGCNVDPKSIQVSPATKFKLNLSREYSAVDYKIWNSNGEALTIMGGDNS